MIEAKKLLKNLKKFGEVNFSFFLCPSNIQIVLMFGKSKYKFNPETLNYDKVKTSVRRTFVKVFTFFTATFAITVVYYLIYIQFFNTPKERILSREIDQMAVNYSSLIEKMHLIEDVLADIQQRDSNIYRTIFESEPVPQALLRAGYGGINRYEALEGYSNTELMVENTRRTEILLSKLRVQSRLMDAMLEKAEEKSEQLKFLPTIQPIENKDLAHTAAGFGMRMHPFYRIKSHHDGIDFTAPIGTPVRATGNGRVVETQSTGAQGIKVVIDHGYGYKTIYAHLYMFTKRTGQNVIRGEIIGTVGNTGLSTAPHLHYEVHKNGKPVNPINYFFNELTPAAFARIRDLSNLGRTFD